ncbi:hypothetical protein UY3_06269 [Chelonia mydas]|uniref:Uncharacterized protein n=1 Tax=Chelonia mydas TaxID=8469 RepID=M7BHA0_CHEMY|nr:hypothetical protein UY3_06269 [Chelonia mydas]
MDGEASMTCCKPFCEKRSSGHFTEDMERKDPHRRIAAEDLEAGFGQQVLPSGCVRCEGPAAEVPLKTLVGAPVGPGANCPTCRPPQAAMCKCFYALPIISVPEIIAY